MIIQRYSKVVAVIALSVLNFGKEMPEAKKRGKSQVEIQMGSVTGTS